MLRVKLVRSPIGNNVRNRRTVAALGLRKLHQVVEHKDTPSIRGMLHKVKHMVQVEEIPDEPEKAPKKTTKKKVEEAQSETE